MILNIMYACNERYVMQAGVSILSLCENNQEFDKLNIYFVEDNLSDTSKNQLLSIVEKYNRSIYFYSMHEVCVQNIIKQESRHPNTIYAKLFMGFLEQVDKILYLDCDSVVSGSFKNLWEMDMGDCIIAGVAMPYSVEVKEKIGMKESDMYICDGFVLIDLIKWRRDQLEDRCVEYIRRWQGMPPMLSEGTINHVCRGRIMILEPKYNLMSIMLLLDAAKISRFFGIEKYYVDEEIREARDRPVFIHYLNELYNRPWNKKCDHPMKEEYYKYLDMSPWRGAALGESDILLKSKVVKWMLKHLPIGIVLKIRSDLAGSCDK